MNPQSSSATCDRLRMTINTLISEIRMRNPATMEKYEERHTYRRDGALDPVKFTAIVRLSQQLNQHLSALPRSVPHLPIPTPTVENSPDKQPLFYDKMVRVARGLPGNLQLDAIMPASDPRTRYNPDDFLVYLQTTIERLGGTLPSRFLPPFLDGMAAPKGLARTEMHRLLANHADALAVLMDDPQTSQLSVREAARAYYDNAFLGLIKHAYLDDPEAGQQTLYGRMPFLQHVGVHLRGSLRRGWLDVMGKGVAQDYQVRNVERDLQRPFAELLHEAPTTGAPLAQKLIAVLGDARGRVLFCVAHLVCRHIAAAQGSRSDEVLREVVFRAAPAFLPFDSVEAFLSPEHLKVVRLTGIGTLLEQAWPLMDRQQRDQFRDALTLHVTGHVKASVSKVPQLQWQPSQSSSPPAASNSLAVSPVQSAPAPSASSPASPISVPSKAAVSPIQKMGRRAHLLRIPDQYFSSTL